MPPSPAAAGPDSIGARPDLQVERVSKRYGSFTAVDDLSLDVARGSFFSILGPSGCGKTTLLNLISGLLTPTQGRILFDGKDITQLGPRERNIAQVFQFPVLYDTMTVFDNLAFPLRNRGMDEALVKQRVDQIAEMLDLSPCIKVVPFFLELSIASKI